MKLDPLARDLFIPFLVLLQGLLLAAKLCGAPMTWAAALTPTLIPVSVVLMVAAMYFLLLILCCAIWAVLWVWCAASEARKA